jgi:hypothetical protein
VGVVLWVRAWGALLGMAAAAAQEHVGAAGSRNARSSMSRYEQSQMLPPVQLGNTLAHAVNDPSIN